MQVFWSQLKECSCKDPECEICCASLFSWPELDEFGPRFYLDGQYLRTVFFPDFNARIPTSFRWIRLHTLHTELPETTKNYAQQIHFALPGYTWFTLVSYGPQSNWVAAVAQLVASLQAVWKIDHLSLMVSAFWGVESSVPSKKGVNWAGLFQTILGKWSPLWGRRMFFFNGSSYFFFPPSHSEQREQPLWWAACWWISPATWKDFASKTSSGGDCKSREYWWLLMTIEPCWANVSFSNVDPQAIGNW